MKEDSAVRYSKQLTERNNGREIVTTSSNDHEFDASNRMETEMNKRVVVAAWCLSLGTTLVGHPAVPAEKAAWAVDEMSLHAIQNTQDHQHMNERGEEGMGFSQSTTSHHFLIQPGGGAIQVTVKDSKDTISRDNIRHHLTHIAKAFANGDFDIPMFVHDAAPPGVHEMKRMRQIITYSFEETPNGGQVMIRTSNSQALVAIHKFLRYQIEEHQTGDPLQVPSSN